jgi:hypothetical protein
MRPLETLVENPRNPNTHSDEQIRLLGRVIGGAGWRSPIVVSRRSGFIVKGHGRFQAALAAGMTHAPVDVQDYATEADEWADMIADNRLAEMAEISGNALKDLLQELDTGAFEMEFTGFTEMELARLMTQHHVDGENKVEDEWTGMPSVVQENILGDAFSCVVRFKTETDRNEFERFLGWKLTLKGKLYSTWFPKSNFDQFGKGLTFEQAQ